MKIINYLIMIVSKTLGEWSFPWVDKKFDLKHYFSIEKRVRELSNPFVVGLVKTNGHGSNILIRIADSLSFDKKKMRGEVTHAFAHIGILKGYKHVVVESFGEGIEVNNLLHSIGQRDNVVLKVPNPKKLNDQLCHFAIEYIREVAKRDATKSIKYDNSHDYKIITIEELKDYSTKNVRMDCSEVIMQALEHGFRKTNQKSLIKMIKRGGKNSWAPCDILYSDLFVDFYVSEGVTDGRI